MGIRRRSPPNNGTPPGRLNPWRPPWSAARSYPCVSGARCAWCPSPSQHRATRSHFEGGHAAAVQHDEPVSVPCAKRSGILCQLCDDVFDDLINLGDVGLVVGKVDVIAAGETDT